ncbi:hypothetical protein EIM44_04890 [Bibersteinia trehalosi]|uniref:Uncharacterized protein n=1 Tax=Bibersteinia trehalosi TaxID=47735 RepID=A0A426FIT9_BIBTR|nr:hypothetical protein [Bibersteinia trehalosi]RRN04777.1 hypothetical protein EIM44_04890 [Bibersteinia trehalosi]
MKADKPRIIECHYYTQYPEAKVKGKLFSISYRVLSRTWDLYQNGQLYGRFRHSDLALLEILRLTVGLRGDELPPKFEPLMASLEKRFLISYQGLESE